MTQPFSGQIAVPRDDPAADWEAREAGADELQGSTRRERRGRIWPYMLKRLLLIPATLLAVTATSFVLVTLLPGDKARAILGDHASPDRIAQVNHELNLKDPVLSQYWRYLMKLPHGDFGNSFFGTKSVGTEISERLPASLELIVPALLLALVLGGMVGIIGAYFAGRPQDVGARGFISLLQSVPDFLLGAVLILVFYSKFGVLPGPEGELKLGDVAPTRRTGSMVIDAIFDGRTDTLWSALSHLVLPVLTLGLVYAAVFGRSVRSLSATVLNSEQTQFARATGQSELRIIGNALLAIRTTLMTQAALVFSSMVGASAVIEIVFSWPGIGNWGVASMLRLDVPAVQGFVLVTGVLTVLMYLGLDVASTLLDPRIRLGRR